MIQKLRERDALGLDTYDSAASCLAAISEADFAASAFHRAMGYMTKNRMQHSWLILFLLVGQASLLRAQPEEISHPFAPGEELTYTAKVGIFGSVGRGVMKVAGLDDFKGRESLLLQFDYEGKFLVFGLENHTRSWVDPVTLRSFRYESSEKSPLATSHDAVDIDPGTGRWSALDGTSGDASTDAPLDELSFMYFVRTLPLNDTLEHSFDRFYNTERNPVRVRVVRREEIAVPAGIFSTILVELRVLNAKRYENKEGVILINFTDDERRLPVRLESSVKTAGSLVLALEHAKIAQDSCGLNRANTKSAPPACGRP